MSQHAKVRFVVAKDALYVANTGRSFDARGVISICHQNLSAKGKRGPITYEGVNGVDLVGTIKDKRLRIYREEINLLLADANREEETRRDYLGRSLWELLQNADDAMAPSGTSSAELIGAKGLGFKSVLEISPRPEIYSGQFNFGFDPELSKRELQQILDDPPPLTFGFPHPMEPDQIARKLRLAGFETVIKLPFGDMASREATVARLRELAPHFLLLSRHLETVEIKFVDGKVRRLFFSGDRGEDRSNARADLVIDNDGTRTKEHWRVWSSSWSATDQQEKRLSVAIAVEVINGTPGPAIDELPLYVFYPTQEHLSADFIVHASFDLHGDRNHLRDDKGRDTILLEQLKKLASKVIIDLPPTSAARVFAKVVDNAQPRPRLLVRKIQKALAMAALEAEFVPVIGGGKHAASDVRTWRHELPAVLNHRAPQVRSMRVASPVVESVFQELEAFGSQVLVAREMASLLRFVRCSNSGDCIRAAATALRSCLMGNPGDQTLNYLREAAFWPTSSGTIRALAESPPLVDVRPKGWPEWLTSDELHRDFVAYLRKATSAERAAWERLFEGYLLRDETDWIKYALVPEIREWNDEHWHLRGWTALGLILIWAEPADWKILEPFIEGAENDNTRESLADVARLPTRKGWVPACDAYAAYDIGGNGHLANFFKNIPDRHVVGFSKEAESKFNKAEWRSLCRYLGVSWEPKVQSCNSSTSHPGRPSMTKYWSENVQSGLKYIQQDWYVEFFPECAANIHAAPLIAMAETLLVAVKPLRATFQKTYTGPSYGRLPGQTLSFVHWQLRNSAWLPCRATIFDEKSKRPAHEIYWPIKGLPGITPNLDLGTTPEARRPAILKLLVTRLGLREELPDDVQAWVRWAEALAEGAEQGNKRIDERLARQFYETMLARDVGLVPGNIAKIVCECAGTEGLSAVPWPEAVWIDVGRLSNAEVRSKLKSAGVNIFLPLLDHGKGAVEKLGVLAASSAVNVRPIFHKASEWRTHNLTRLLTRRHRALSAVCASKKLRLPVLPTVIAVQGLSLEIAFQGQPVVALPATDFKHGDHWLVDWDGRLTGLANAVAEQYGPTAAADLRHRFRPLLAALGREVLDILTGDGIPEYTLRELKLELASEASETEMIRENADAEPDVERSDLETDELDAEEDVPDDEEAPDVESGEPSADVNSLGTAAKAFAGKLSSRELYGSGERRGKGSSASRRESKQAAISRARGLAAEEWLREKIRTQFPAAEIGANVRDDYNRETDILLRLPGQELHIEVKCLTSERIYWSKLEQEKAELFPDQYAMALLVQDGHGYQIRWCWDPLVDLLRCERRIDWVWDTVEQGPPLACDTWRLPEGLPRPDRRPDTLAYVVRIEQTFFDDLDLETQTLHQLKTRLSRAAAA